MIPLTVGIAYRFYLMDEFKALDGVYVLGKIMTFDETLDEGVDLSSEFFVPSGLNDTRYAKDIDKIQASDILRLLDPDTSEPKYYVPAIYLSKVPDHNVKKYWTLALGINVGYLDEVKLLESTVSTMKEHVIALTGIDADPDIFELTSKWMSDEEYKTYSSFRDKKKMKVINYFSENKKLRDEITRLKSRLAGYAKRIEVLHEKGII